MAVYVDGAAHRFGRMVMCHMLADTSEELVAMAERIGVPRKWLQAEGTYREHFDVCLKMRARAVALGAIEVSRAETGRLLATKRLALR